MEEIIKAREYLLYIEEHYNNVQNAWKIIKENCDGVGFDFIDDDFKFFTLSKEIEFHDKSKLSKEEFVPYRRKFFPTEFEKENFQESIDAEFKKAWEHHKLNNNHHWEHWIKYDNPGAYPNDTGYVVHNVCDWMAMGMKFGDTAKAYYENNKNNISIPAWAEKFMYEIFDCIY